MKRAVVLMNLGSPDSTEVKDVKRYLDEFLMDARVIDKPLVLRALLVKGIIVPFRAPKSAAAYRSIWTDKGSPLIDISRQQAEAVENALEEPVVIAMRYSTPSPREAFDKLVKQHPGLEEVIIIPMYPHYAMSSYETALAYARKHYQKGGYTFRLTAVKPFYNNDDYVNALSDSIRPWLQPDYDHILFSYHGIPERHVQKSDVTGSHCLKVPNCCQTPSPAHARCYRHQCFATTQLVVNQLNIPDGKWSISFQSRLGRDPWLQPFTDKRLEELPSQGVKNLLVASPAFVADCLETLEEIAVEGKESFLHAGGERFQIIPCLNVHPLWIQAMVKWIQGIEAGEKNMIMAD